VYGNYVIIYFGGIVLPSPDLRSCLPVSRSCDSHITQGSLEQNSFERSWRLDQKDTWTRKMRLAVVRGTMRCLSWFRLKCPQMLDLFLVTQYNRRINSSKTTH